jgi:hypothetical protein
VFTLLLFKEWLTVIRNTSTLADVGRTAVPGICRRGQSSKRTHGKKTGQSGGIGQAGLPCEIEICEDGSILKAPCGNMCPASFSGAWEIEE